MFFGTNYGDFFVTRQCMSWPTFSISGSGRCSQVSFGVEPSMFKTAAAQVPDVCQQYVWSGQAVLQWPAGATWHPQATGGGGPGHGSSVSHRLMQNHECWQIWKSVYVNTDSIWGNQCMSAKINLWRVWKVKLTYAMLLMVYMH